MLQNPSDAQQTHMVPSTAASCKCSAHALNQAQNRLFARKNFIASRHMPAKEADQSLARGTLLALKMIAASVCLDLHILEHIGDTGEYLARSEDCGNKGLHSGAVHCVICHFFVQHVIKGKRVMLHVLCEVHLDARLMHCQLCLCHYRFY